MEEVAAKAKEAMGSNGHVDEEAKTQGTNGTEAHQEVSEVSAAESTEAVPEPVEATKAETPVLEGDSSALELQTSNFQGEAVH